MSLLQAAPALNLSNAQPSTDGSNALDRAYVDDASRLVVHKLLDAATSVAASAQKHVLFNSTTATAVADPKASICVVELTAKQTTKAQAKAKTVAKAKAVAKANANAKANADAKAAAKVNAEAAAEVDAGAVVKACGSAGSTAIADGCAVLLHEVAGADLSDAQSVALRDYGELSEADKSALQELASIAYVKEQEKLSQASAAECELYAQMPRPCVYSSYFGGQVAAYSSDADMADTADNYGDALENTFVEEEEEEEEERGAFAYNEGYITSKGSEIPVLRTAWGCEDVYDSNDRADKEHSLEAKIILNGDLDEVLLSETSSEWSSFDKRIVKDCDAHLIDCNTSPDSASMDSSESEQDVDAPAYIWPTGSSRIREREQAAAASAAAAKPAASATAATANTVASTTTAATTTAPRDSVSVALESEIAALKCAAVLEAQANVTRSATVALSPDLSVQVSVSMPCNTNCQISLESHIDAIAHEAKILNFEECSKLGTASPKTAQKPQSFREAILAESDDDAHTGAKPKAAATASKTAPAIATASKAAPAAPAAAVAATKTTAAKAKAKAAVIARANASAPMGATVKAVAHDSDEHKAGAMTEAKAKSKVKAGAVAKSKAVAVAVAVANDEEDQDQAKLKAVEDKVAQERYAKLQSMLLKVKPEDRHLCPIALRLADMSRDCIGFGTAQAYDAVDALSVKVPLEQRMCPEGFILYRRSWKQEICSCRRDNINADGTKVFLKSGLSRRALNMLANSSVQLFANKDEAFYALLQVLTLPVIELMANPNVNTIALGTDTRVLYKHGGNVITVLPAVDQNNINLLARELVYLNSPERIHDSDISDVIGRVGIGGFYFKCDVPPHSSVPVVTMWRVAAKTSKPRTATTPLASPIEPNYISVLRPSSYAAAQQPSVDASNAAVPAFASVFAADADAQACAQLGAMGVASVQTHHSVPSSDSGSADSEDVSWRQHSAPGSIAQVQARAAEDSTPDHGELGGGHCHSQGSGQDQDQSRDQAQGYSQAQAQAPKPPEDRHGDLSGLCEQESMLEDEWLDAESRADAEAEVAALLLKAAANKPPANTASPAAAAATTVASAAIPAATAVSTVAAAGVGGIAGLTLIGRIPPGPPIEAAQDDPGEYAVTDCRFDPDALKHRPLSLAQQHTIEYCGRDEDKHEGKCPIAVELGLSLRLSDRAWKMMEKIDSKWRSGNYNIESLRMLTFLIGPVILELLANPEVTEIAVNSDKRLFVNTYTQRSVELQNSQSTYMDALMRLLSSMLDIALTPDKHILSGILPIDGSRVECNRPPVVPNPTLVIRKHSACSLTLDRLMDLGMMNLTQYILLEHALKDRLSIIVSGETGSGKTTLLSALINQLADIYPRERVICLEDTPELQPQIANCTHAYTSDSTSMSQLVCSALRQHPDRIVVGEVRGPEALDLIDALSTGHKGSFSSMHAGSPEEAVKRLGLMISRNPEAPENYNDLIVGAIDLIIQMESRPNPHIRCIECITGIDENGICVQPLRTAAELSGFKNNPNN